MSRLTTDQEDLGLLSAIAQGDKRARAKLVDKYRDRIWFYLRKNLDQSGEADEICQEVFAEILEQAHSGSIKIYSTFSQYLYGVAWNKRCKLLREKIRERTRIEHIDGAGAGRADSAWAEPELEPMLEEKEFETQLKTVVKLFKQLPEFEQQVLHDYWMLGMSSKAAGEKHGISDALVRQLASRARKRIRKQAQRAFKRIVTFWALLIHLV